MDIRSVHPGLWNDRWELPFPFVEGKRIGYYPKGLNIGEVAAETISKMCTLRENIDTICKTTALMYGYPALQHLEDHDDERAEAEADE